MLHIDACTQFLLTLLDIKLCLQLQDSLIGLFSHFLKTLFFLLHQFVDVLIHLVNRAHRALISGQKCQDCALEEHLDEVLQIR